MADSKQTIEQFIAAQVEKWQDQTKAHVPVITLSTEPGSGGRIVARRLAEQLKLDLFDRDIVKGVADSVRLSDQVIKSIEQERLSGIKDFISVLVDDKYLYPGIYLQHLIKVVTVIAKHGNAIIVGRGANFIIPPENLITEGYGEQFLKIPTFGPERRNRRASIRRLTNLLYKAEN